ncbi:MAG: hypothetical protein ACE5FY_05070 [Nitrospiria bacterium]
MNRIAALNHWVHLISVVFWIGGAAYQVFVMAPLLKTGDFSKETILKISKRFRGFSILFLLILVVTGGMNMGFRRVGHDAIPPGYVSALAVKVFLVVAMACFPLFDLIHTRSKDPDADQENQPVIPGLGFTRVTLALGVVVIFLASMLRHWKF